MKYIVLSGTILNHVESKIQTLTPSIKEHESNLKTIESVFDELIKDNSVNVERFSKFCYRNVRYDICEDLARYIEYELSSKHKDLLDSVIIHVASDNLFMSLSRDGCKEFMLDGNKFYIRFTLSSKVNELINTRHKLSKIKNKCQFVEQFILDEEEYQFIFGE